MQPVRIEIILDDKMTQGANRARQGMTGLGNDAKAAKREVEELDRTTQSMDKTFRRLAGAFAIKELVSKIANVRGEVQQLEVAFRTMLGSVSKADELLQQLVRTAAITPFGLEDVANGAKQLLAYGLEAEKVNETLVRLGDIAAGLSIPLNDLVYLYGTTMAQGRLYTQDLNQFTGRGIPMISELAKQFGVAESKVKELVEAGKVGFPEVQKVIESLTNEGGKFGGLMEEQSKTITGQISNIEDAVFMMFNEIGQQSEGVINSTLSGVSYMIENYERFGRILLGLVGTYGVYRTAIMAVVAMKGWATAAEALHYNWLLLVEKAQKTLNTTMLSNPYVLVATLLAGVCVALISMKTETERLKEAEEDYQQQKEKVIEAEDEHRRKIEELCSIAGDEAVSTDTRREALNKLEMKYPDIFAKYGTEYEKLKNIKKIKEEIAALDGQKSITRPENELVAVNKRIAELEAKAATERTTSYTTNTGTYTQTVGGLSSAEKAELKNLRNKRGSLQTQVRKNEANAYFENLTGVSNDTLEAEIKRRKDLLAKMQLEEKKYGTITQSASQLNGTYSRDELQYQLNKLQSERNRRNKPTDSSADWAASAKKKYEEALKSYNTFIKNTSNTLSQEDFEKRAKELRDAVDVAKKEYDKVKPQSDKEGDSTAKQAQRQREKAEREAAKRLEIQRKLGQELVAVQQESDQAETEAMDEGLEKKLKQIEDEYQAKKNAIAKQKSDWETENGKAGLGSALSEDQQAALDRSAELNEERRQKAIAEAYRAEFALMQEQLRQYGTYQQQKLAITSEYAEKIRKAGSETEKQTLSRERDSMLAHVKADELRSNVDWGVVFGEFGTMFTKVIEPVLADAKAYVQTDEFKNSDHESQKALLDAIRQMEKSMGGAGNVSFKKLGNEINEYQSAMVRVQEAQEEYARCYAELEKAQKAYILAQTDGTEAEKTAAEQALAIAQDNEAAAAKNVETLQATANAAQRTVTDTATMLKDSMDGVVEGLQQLSSGSLSGAYKGLITLGDSAKKMGGVLGKAFGKVAESLKDIPIIGWIASIIDVFKDGLSVVVGGILDAVFNAISGILDDILSGDLFVTLGESILSGVGKIFDAITWGGFSSWFGSGDSDKHLAEDIEYLTNSNKDLKKAIDNLADQMSEGAVSDAQSVYERQKALLEQSMANTQEMMARSASAYSNGFLGIGGHHSTNYKIDKGMSSADWARISEITGKNITSAGAFFGLSSEDMAKVFNEANDLYSKIKSLADDGYKDASKYMDDYIDYYRQIEELQDALREKLTGISFGTLRGNFKSQLLDMKSDAKTMGENIGETLFESMVESLMSEKYDKRLKEWYEAFADYMSDDGRLSEQELAELKRRYQGIVDDAIRERDALADAMGYNPEKGGTSQSGKAGSYNAISQDQGTKLEGLFVSAQMHLASIDQKIEDVTGKWGAASDALSRIEENTGSNAKSAEEIKELLVKIARDGIRTK